MCGVRDRAGAELPPGGRVAHYVGDRRRPSTTSGPPFALLSHCSLVLWSPATSHATVRERWFWVPPSRDFFGLKSVL